MALLKQIGRVLPVSPMALLKAIGFAQEQSTTKHQLAILIDSSLDPALLAYAKQALKPQSSNLGLVVLPYFGEPPILPHDSAAVVVFAAAAPATGRVMIEALKQQLPAVVVTLDAVKLQQVARDNYHEIDPLSIIAPPYRALLEASESNDLHNFHARDDAEAVRFASLFEELGGWMVRTLPAERLAFARALDFVRDPFISDATQAIAVQNAAISAVFFIPGADMPVLTLNQARLFLQIAAVYETELEIKRLWALGVVLLGGFGFRTIARRVVGMVPVLGWAVRGAVGYTGTLAVGKAAQAYFKAVN